MYARVYDAAWDSPLTAAVGERVATCLAPGRLTVDLGCGTGLISAALQAQGHRVLGLDSSLPMIFRARQTGRIRSSVLARADQSGLPDGCASSVAAVNLLHVVEDPAAVLDEAVRLSAPRARVALVWPLDDVDPAALRSAESQLGWARSRSARAAAARASVALPGLVLRVRRHSSDDLRRLVHEAAVRHDLSVLVEETYLGCQHLCVLGPDTGVGA